MGMFSKLKIQRLWSRWIAMLILVIISLGLIYPYAKEQWLIDSCLDSGGAWSESKRECRRQ